MGRSFWIIGGRGRVRVREVWCWKWGQNPRFEEANQQALRWVKECQQPPETGKEIPPQSLRREHGLADTLISTQ